MIQIHIEMKRWEYLFGDLWLKEADKANGRIRETARGYFDRKLHT